MAHERFQHFRIYRILEEGKQFRELGRVLGSNQDAHSLDLISCAANSYGYFRTLQNKPTPAEAEILHNNRTFVNLPIEDFETVGRMLGLVIKDKID